MVAGGFIAGLAFVCSGVLEYELEQTYPMLPSKGEAFINFVNTLPCDLTLVNEQGVNQLLTAEDMVTIKKNPVTNFTIRSFRLSAPRQCGSIVLSSTVHTMSIPVQEYEVGG